MDLHWLKIEERIEYEILTIIFKATHNQAPKYIVDVFSKPRLKSLRSMNSNKLFQDRTNMSNLAKRSIRIASVKLWNNLPMDLRNCDSLDIFKKGLKAHLFVKSHDL